MIGSVLEDNCVKNQYGWMILSIGYVEEANLSKNDLKKRKESNG